MHTLTNVILEFNVFFLTVHFVTLWITASCTVFDNTDSVDFNTSNPETHPKTETSRWYSASSTVIDYMD